MVSGVISAIIGAIIFIISLTVSVSSALQQQVQYLGYVCASIFIVGGFIMITIKKSLEITEYRLSNIERNLNRQDSTTNQQSWNCPKCGEKNPNTTYKCEKCGYSLN
jgi:predicted tellurium resistance membrane protein TerC